MLRKLRETLRTFSVAIGCLSLVLPCARSAAAQVEEGGVSGGPSVTDDSLTTSFQFEHLAPGVAQMLVLELCSETDESCRLLSRPGTSRAGGSVAVAGSPSVLARIGRDLLSRDAIESTHRFRVAIVEATIKGSRDLSGLTEDARRALEDAVTVLPYDGLALLDVALIETADEAVTRVTGPGGIRYRVALEIEPVVTLEGLRLMVDRFELQREPQAGPDGRQVTPITLLASSFSLTPDQTIVVGTSRLDGDDGALVVLVTAVPSSVAP